MLRWLGRLFGGSGGVSSGNGVGAGVSREHVGHTGALGTNVTPGSARIAKERLSLILQSNTRALNDFSMVDMHKDIFQVIQGQTMKAGKKDWWQDGHAQPFWPGYYQRYLPVVHDDVTISVKKDRGLDIFEMQIALPDNVQALSRKHPHASPRPVVPLSGTFPSETMSGPNHPNISDASKMAGSHGASHAPSHQAHAGSVGNSSTPANAGSGAFVSKPSAPAHVPPRNN